MFVQAVHTLCTEELLDRAKNSWAVILRVIDGEGLFPSEENKSQIRSIVEDVVKVQSSDISGVYERACRQMPGSAWQTLDEARQHAVDTAVAEAEIDLLSRNARRPPLLDELAPPRYQVVREHWSKAIALSNQEKPDLPNALKEVASSVESLAQTVLGKPGLTLGDATKELRSTKRLPTGSDKILDGLYAFASDSPGARHGSTLPARVDPSHWEFARTTAEGAIRLLLDIDVA